VKSSRVRCVARRTLLPVTEVEKLLAVLAADPALPPFEASCYNPPMHMTIHRLDGTQETRDIGDHGERELPERMRFRGHGPGLGTPWTAVRREADDGGVEYFEEEPS
jgi:hypothetical protein